MPQTDSVGTVDTLRKPLPVMRYLTDRNMLAETVSLDGRVIEYARDWLPEMLRK
jgi:hypothetical protein